ncbi:hypothetical protein RIF25_12670 [Thermosynechococcaceae cyanobacterium BACA0444]|uniref:Uncharacterized protein n=1 Tax=Pseudocalidococcus azoricus BACA0444 TaxID=2918990 RepID=A0AAE4JZ32_9CYAN|nr:hypothetical protein [Pseudocalidococcus azoricus]MDS3861659.1 hypothetical protein [Pseudocalidococcus azoricus BACA0444]
MMATTFMGLLVSGSIKHPTPLAIGALLGLLIPIFFLAVVHKSLFRRQVPGWFPRWSSWYEGTAIIVGSILTFLVMTPFAYASCGRYFRYYSSYCHYTDQKIGMILTIGLVFGAFFFQSEYLIRDAIGNRKKASKPKVSQPAQPTIKPQNPDVEPPQKLQSNSLLSELARLKKELGR